MSVLPLATHSTDPTHESCHLNPVLVPLLHVNNIRGAALVFGEQTETLHIAVTQILAEESLAVL